MSEIQPFFLKKQPCHHENVTTCDASVMWISWLFNCFYWKPIRILVCATLVIIRDLQNKRQRRDAKFANAKKREEYYDTIRHVCELVRRLSLSLLSGHFYDGRKNVFPSRRNFSFKCTWNVLSFLDLTYKCNCF